MRPQYLVIPKNQQIEMIVPEIAENSKEKKMDKTEAKLGHENPGQARKPSNPSTTKQQNHTVFPICIQVMDFFKVQKHISIRIASEADEAHSAIH